MIDGGVTIRYDYSVSSSAQAEESRSYSLPITGDFSFFPFSYYHLRPFAFFPSSSPSYFINSSPPSPPPVLLIYIPLGRILGAISNLSIFSPSLPLSTILPRPFQPGPSPWPHPAKLTRTWVSGSLVHATLIRCGQEESEQSSREWPRWSRQESN